jgi:hypothetical protein
MPAARSPALNARPHERHTAIFLTRIMVSIYRFKHRRQTEVAGRLVEILQALFRRSRPGYENRAVIATAAA